MDLRAIGVGVVSFAFASNCNVLVSLWTRVSFVYALVEVNTNWFAAAV